MTTSYPSLSALRAGVRFSRRGSSGLRAKVDISGQFWFVLLPRQCEILGSRPLLSRSRLNDVRIERSRLQLRSALRAYTSLKKYVVSQSYNLIYDSAFLSPQSGYDARLSSQTLTKLHILAKNLQYDCITTCTETSPRALSGMNLPVVSGVP